MERIGSNDRVGTGLCEGHVVGKPHRQQAHQMLVERATVGRLRQP
jgi:hypothetical protein